WCGDDEQGGHQHRVAGSAIAEGPEHHASNWPGKEANAERGERRQCTSQRAELRKEQLRKRQRCCSPVQKEVVPLDSGPYEARKGYAPDRRALVHVMPAYAVHHALGVITSSALDDCSRGPSVGQCLAAVSATASRVRRASVAKSADSRFGNDSSSGVRSRRALNGPSFEVSLSTASILHSHICD